VGARVFVNYGGFTLVPIEEINETYDPTRDKLGLDWLGIDSGAVLVAVGAHRSISYIAMADRDVVVSKRRQFIERLREGA
jgi:hypothetical protein